MLIQTANFVKENPALVAGVLMLVAPTVIKTPIIGVTRVLDLTSGGIAASKSIIYNFVLFFTARVANKVHNGTGSPVQSAAARGYGRGIAGVLALRYLLRGDRQNAQPPREELNRHRHTNPDNTFTKVAIALLIVGCVWFYCMYRICVSIFRFLLF